MAILSKGPLAYTGVSSANPPNFFSVNRAPTEKDYKKFKIGDIWSVKGAHSIYMLTDIGNNLATWTDISSDLTDDLTITPGDLTITDGDFYLKNGGFVYSSNNYKSTLRTLSDGTVYGLPDGQDGEILIGATGLSPSWQTIKSSGGTVTITESPNGINLEAAGGTATDTYTTDDGNAVVPTAGGNVDLQGGNNITTSGAVANQVLFDLDDNITLTSVSTSGDLTTGGNFALTGTLHVGGATTLTAALTINTAEGVLLSSGAGAISSSPGTAGQILTSNGVGVVPTWQDNNDSSLSINTQGGNYTIVLGDAGDEIKMTSPIAANLTIPADATTNFPIGTELLVVQYGAGTITVVASAGVTLNSAGSRTDSYEKFSVMSLIKQGVNEWLLAGDIK